MNKSQLSHIIQSHQRKLKKQLGHISTTYDPEQLHDFRVTFKKTRAFIRMLQSDSGNHKKIKISKKIKPCYCLAGNLRDLHLLQQHITEITGKKQPPLEYLNLLEKKIDTTKQALFQEIATKPIAKAGKKIKHVPEKLSTKDFDRYAKDKWEDANKIVVTGNFAEQHLHAVRKNLKDLFYNLKTVEAATKKKLSKHLPAGINEDKLNLLLTDLGNFQDKCTAVKLLNSSVIKSLGTPDKQALTQIKRKWTLEKNAQKKSLVKKLRRQFSISSANHPPTVT